MWHILDFYLNILEKDFSFSAITVMLLTTNIPCKEQYALLMLLYIKKIKKYVLSLILCMAKILSTTKNTKVNYFHRNVASKY